MATPDPGEGTAATGNAVIPNFTIDPFDREKTKWARWVKRLEGAFRMFGVPDNRKKDYLLHYMGAPTYDLLCDHVTPAEPEDKTYQELVTTMGAFFDPEPLEMVEVWKFRSRKQKEGETIMEFITELQRDAKFCKFEGYLEKELRNQLVFGMRSKRIRSRLIEEKNLTFDKAKEIAVSMEASGEGAEVLERKHEVNYTERTTMHRGSGRKVTNHTNRKCYRCGSGAHLASVCKHKDAVCNFCKKVGHLQRVCLRFASQSTDGKESKTDRLSKSKKKWHAHMIEEESDQSSCEGSCEDETDVDDVCVLDICKVDDDTSTSLSKIILPLKVNKAMIRFEVDCGSPVSVVSLTDKKRYLNDAQLEQTSVELVSYCGNRIEVCGYVNVEVEYKGRTSILRLFVVNTKKHPLLGREWMRELHFDWNKVIRNSDFTVNT